MTELKIEDRIIGPGRPTFVIAEIGVNHDGSPQKALELVRIAANCGADAVKLQLFRASILMHPTTSFAEYQKDKTRDESPIDMLRKYELAGDALRKIMQNIRELKMIPLATPFSPGDIETAAQLRLPAVKIASPDMVNRPLLAAAHQYNKPMIISTGASTIEEVDQTVAWLQAWRAPFALLHCVSAYPTPAGKANLGWIGELAARYNVPVGYSDHTTDVVTGALASAAGALIVEKHLTYDRNARGPDHSSSVDPTQFARYVKQLREADEMRGGPGKRVLDIEQDVRNVSRQSLVVKRAVAAGEVLREQDITVQRPGTGMSASMIDVAIGRRAKTAIPAGAILQLEMLADAA